MCQNSNSHVGNDHQELTKEFIYLTMLAFWVSSSIDWPDKPIQVIEYFAGASRICKLAAWCGYESRGLS